jgi:Domain of unknown function (DUF4357)
VKSHLEKDFWNQIVFFTSKDENLTKAHIRYLEGQLIEHAKNAGRALVKNSQGSGSKLPESDREDMEVFLKKMQQLLPALGVEILVPIPGSSDHETTAEFDLLTCEIKGLKATGYQTPNGIVVLSGSQAVLAERESSQKYRWSISLRERLKEDGSLVASGECLVFTKNVEFTSPSAAAAVVHGGQANGLTAWKNKAGKSLKELESA